MNKDFMIQDGVLMNYYGTEKIIEIPKNIKEIKEYAFANNDDIEKIIMHDNILELGAYAFKNCKKLKEIQLSKKINEIPIECFKDCIKLKNINLENIETIEESAFENCGIEKIDLSKAKNIENFAFYECENLKEIIFDKKIDLIGDSAFSCTGIKNVYIENAKFIDSCAFLSCEELTNAYIKSKDIGVNIFDKCKKLKEIKLETKKTIDTSLANDCKNLEKIEFLNEINPDNVYFIIGCNNKKLKNFISPNTICENGIIYNKDKTILIAYLESKEDKIFKIPETVEEISKILIWENNYIEELYMNDKIKEINADIAIGCNNLKKIVFGNNLEEIYSQIYEECPNLKELDFRKSKIKTFNDKYIIDSKITIKLPNSIKNLHINSEETMFLVDNKSNIIINGNTNLVKQIQLEDLLVEGKTFREVNNIIKEQIR